MHAGLTFRCQDSELLHLSNNAGTSSLEFCPIVAGEELIQFFNFRKQVALDLSSGAWLSCVLYVLAYLALRFSPSKGLFVG
jgi:hypothetical protein